MSPTKGSAAPASGTSELTIPDFADLAADPEIAPELQRELIARIAATGTVQAAVWQMGKHATGAEALYKTPGANSFRTSWDAAIIIGRRRNGLDSQPPYRGPVPGITRRGSFFVTPDLIRGLPYFLRSEEKADPGSRPG